VPAIPAAADSAGAATAAPAAPEDALTPSPLAFAEDPRAFDEPRIGPSGLPLFDGEEELVVLTGCIVHPNTASQCVGTLVVTNFALRYREGNPGSAEPPRRHVHALRHFPVPLASIARVVHKDVQARRGEAVPSMSARLSNASAPGAGDGGGGVGSPGSSPRAGSAAARLEIWCKDFRRLVFLHPDPLAAIRTIVTRAFPGDQRALFAFEYRTPITSFNGIVLANQSLHLARVNLPTETTHWRVTDINASYELCPTYPRLMAVPAGISDAQLRQVAGYRTRGRIPMLSWRCAHNGAVIARSSQPGVGLSGRRCAADDAMINALTSETSRPLRIVDARPVKNAVANRVKGGGYEDHMSKALTFAGIERIQVMRKSLVGMVAGIDPATGKVAASASGGPADLSWLEHVRLVVAAAAYTARSVVVDGTSVLVHCSDGWDRTAQISALAQVMCDPYYRTFEGFAVVVEKEWILAGHRFAIRVGHASGDHAHDQRSPVFIQWLDAVWQLLTRFPGTFEFSGGFLRAIADALYSGQYGTFLYDCQRERDEAGVGQGTVSLWTELMVRRKMFADPLYEPMAGPLPVIQVRQPSDFPVEVWSELYAQ
jgi:myotubularin-related protein 1/2